MKTKNMNVNFHMSTGEWNARDNGKIIAKGRGITSAALFQKEWRETQSKPIRFNLYEW